MSRKLGDFVVNVILCDEGRAMYFDCYDFEEQQMKKNHISYLSNQVIYLEDGTKRTTYKLTDNGYNLILSTLEVESNMKLSIHEIIFKMHLERATYDKALEEVKNIFNLLRIQLQKIQEAMGRIRRNVLNYSVTDYQQILEENLAAIGDTKEKFLEYRQVVKTRVRQLEEENINLKVLGEDDRDKLHNLQKIEDYLNRGLEEHQKILNHHFDLKELYTKELEQMSLMSMVKRFSLRSELYDPILMHPGQLTKLEYFIRPLLRGDGGKIYNINRCMQEQQPIRNREETEEEEVLGFDAEEYEEEKERKMREKMMQYEGCLDVILSRCVEHGHCLLSDFVTEDVSLVHTLIPNVEVFKEIMVELIKARYIDLEQLRQERSEYIMESGTGFQLHEMVLDIVESRGLGWIQGIEINRCTPQRVVHFEYIQEEKGTVQRISCSDVKIHIKD